MKTQLFIGYIVIFAVWFLGCVVFKNNSALISGTLQGSMTEDMEQVVGQLSIEDIEEEQYFQTENPNLSGTYGDISLTSNGSWTYRLNNANRKVQALTRATTLTDTLTISAADGTTQNITINIQGLNDAAIIQSTDTPISEDELDPITGTVSITDADAGEAGFHKLNHTGAFGDFTLEHNGNWHYQLKQTPQVQSLPAEATLDEHIVITSTDGTEHTIRMTVQGKNDAAEIGGTHTGTLTEDSHQDITHTLTIQDIDTDQRTFNATSQTHTYGTLSIEESGQWTYHLDHDKAQTLAANEIIHETFGITSVDGTPHSIEITLTGLNDEAIITGLFSGNAIEDNREAVIGTVTAQDIDANQNTFNTEPMMGHFGELHIDQSGQWQYFLNHQLPQVQALGDKIETIDPLVITSIDGTEQPLNITVQGRNDVAHIYGIDARSTHEDATEIIAAQLDIDDPDAREAIFKRQDIAGQYGQLSISPSGQWTYHLKHQLEKTQSLQADVSATDEIQIHSADGTPHTIIITIHGRNDIAQIGGVDAGQVKEDLQLHTSGELWVIDPDGGENAFNTQSIQGRLGQLKIESDGKWHYQLDNTLVDVQSLKLGHSVLDELTISTLDGTEQNINITVQGNNDAANIGGDTSALIAEDSQKTLSGVLTVKDLDTGEAAFQAQEFSGHYGTFSIAVDGQWDYRLNHTAAALKQIRADQKKPDVFTILAQDTTRQTITILVQGVNNPANIQGTVNGTVNETQRSVSGLLSIQDDDQNESTFTQSTTQGQYGQLSITDAGQWIYTLQTQVSALKKLGAGRKLTETFAISSLDGTVQNISIQLNASNSRANISGKRTGNITQHQLKISGQLTITDQDEHEAGFIAQTLTGQYGRLTLAVSGRWHYNLTQAHKLRTLGEGLTNTDRFRIKSIDGTTDHITITLLGDNDPAVIGGDITGSVTEDSQHEAQGQLTIRDNDTNEAKFTAATLEGTFGRLVITPQGAWRYTLHHTAAAIQALAADATAKDQVTIRSADGSTQTLHITIHGNNDKAIISGTTHATIVEDSDTQSVTGLLRIKDIDTGETRFQPAKKRQGDYGHLSIDTSGLWVYHLNHSSQHIQALTKGLSLTDVFTVLAFDGTTQNISITILGADDAPDTSNNMRGAVTEDVIQHVTVWSTLSDVDTLEATFTTAQTLSGRYGSLSIDAFGKWTYTLNNRLAEVQALGHTQTLIDTLSASAIDGTPRQMTITIHGSNDTAVIGGTHTGTVANTPKASTQGQLTIQDIDTGEAGFTAEDALAGTYGMLSIDAQGHWVYTLAQQAANTTTTDRVAISSLDGTQHQIIIHFSQNLPNQATPIPSQ